jgi:hypothetical protein
VHKQNLGTPLNQFTPEFLLNLHEKKRQQICFWAAIKVASEVPQPQNEFLIVGKWRHTCGSVPGEAADEDLPSISKWILR